MARRVTEGSVKSPVNIIVGMLLKRLRERSDKQLDQIAPALDVSPAYLAAIEAGTNALPAKSVAGLGTLGLDFVAASALLTLVNYLDCRMKNSRIYDFREVQLRAEGLLRQTGALALKPFIKWTIATIRSTDRGASLDSQRGLQALEIKSGATFTIETRQRNLGQGRASFFAPHTFPYGRRPSRHRFAWTFAAYSTYQSI